MNRILFIFLKQFDIQEKSGNLSSGIPLRVKRRRFKSNASRSSQKTAATSPDRVTLEEMLNENEFEMLNKLVYKCSAVDQRLQKKMDYYYGAYGYHQDCQAILPLSFETSENYEENANVKWGALTKIILQNNGED